MVDGRRGFGAADRAIEVFENLVGDAVRAVWERAKERVEEDDDDAEDYRWRSSRRARDESGPTGQPPAWAILNIGAADSVPFRCPSVTLFVPRNP